MDSTDLLILSKLSQNPLLAYRELATSLGISVQAVHRRIQVLSKKKVLGKYHANIPLGYLRAVSVHFVGRSSGGSMDDVLKGLARSTSVRTALIASANVLFIHAELRSIDALDEFSEFAKRTSLIHDPRIAIDPMEDQSKGTMTPLDLRIIRSMHNDARKPTVDVAEELGVSARSVRTHLDKMIADGLIELTVEIDPTFSEDTSSILRVFLNENSDKKRIGAMLMKQHFPKVLYCQSFVNIPDFLICAAVSRTPNDLKRLQEGIQQEQGIRSVESNIALTGRYFETWRDELVESCEKDRAKEIAEKLARNR